MKVFRFAGLLVIAAALLTGSAKSATATGPVTCWSVCSDHEYSTKCWLSLAQCCRLNRRCPDPWVFQAGDCTTNGTDSCPIP